MGKWHLSKYNIFSSEVINNKVPCANLLKTTYSEIDLNDLERLYHLENIENIEEELKDFIKQGIISNYNEQELIKSSLLMNNNKLDSYKIIIAPSLVCNFNCPYCFEGHSDRNVMDKETQDKVINFIKNTLSFNMKRKIEIIWYGGEPLLHPEIIEYISNSIISFCSERNIQYTAGILTNGYFFNQKNADILSRSKVNRVQITLDGLKENHDKTRHLFNGQGSFDVIINNLKTVKYNGTINIRNDVHNNNKKDIEELKSLLSEISIKNNLKINYYIAPIVNNPAEEPTEEQVDFLNIQDSIEYELKRRGGGVPNFKTTYCTAPSLFFFGIDSHGNLCKCWEDFGVKDRVYGNVETWDIRKPLTTATNPDILMRYMNDVGVLDPDCYDCIWLPICGGGCPSKKFYCNMKCVPYVPYKFDVDYFMTKVREYYNSDNKNECQCKC